MSQCSGATVPLDIGEPGQSWAQMERVQSVAGTLITRASIDSIAYAITDTATDAVVASGTLVKTDVIEDTLQTDSGWNTRKDADGWNLRVVWSGDEVPSAGQTLRYTITITATDDTVAVIRRDRQASD